jgi:hypothetical protein
MTVEISGAEAKRQISTYQLVLPDILRKTKSPRKSSLFLLTVLKLCGVTASETGQPEKRSNGWKSTLSLEVSSAFSTVLETQRE